MENSGIDIVFRLFTALPFPSLYYKVGKVFTVHKSRHVNCPDRSRNNNSCHAAPPHGRIINHLDVFQHRDIRGGIPVLKAPFPKPCNTVGKENRLKVKRRLFKKTFTNNSYRNAVDFLRNSVFLFGFTMRVVKNVHIIADKRALIYTSCNLI